MRANIPGRRYPSSARPGLAPYVEVLMSHDQVFKELLRAFFREFLQLFLPEVAEQIDFENVRFLEPEVFTDLPKGRRRTADLVAEIVASEGGESRIVLIHLEIQGKKGREFPRRMFEFHSMI